VSQLLENLMAKPLADPDIGSGSNLQNQTLRLLERQEAGAPSFNQDPEGAFCRQSKATGLCPRLLVIQKNQDVLLVKGQRQELSLPSSEDDAGGIGIEYLFRSFDDGESTDLKEQPNRESIRLSLGYPVQDNLAINRMRNLDDFVEINQQIQAIDLAQGDQRPGVDEDGTQSLSAQLFRQRLRAERGLEAPGIGVPG
jgi:hypothetical protein